MAGSRYRVVVIVTVLQTGQSRVLIAVGARDFCLLKVTGTNSTAHPAFCLVGTRVKVARV